MAKDSVEQVREDMHDRIKSIHNRTDEILNQVKVTNGRVTKLEEWKSQFVGGMKVGSVIVGFFAFTLKMGWITLT